MNTNRRHIAQFLYVSGILISLATFLLQLIPMNWGIFLSTASFIVGSVLWPGWDSVTNGGGSKETGK